MKLCTTTADFAEYSADSREIIEYIRRAGFRYIDYNFDLDYSKKAGVFGENCEQYIKELKVKAKNLDVEFVQAHSPMGAPIAKDNGDFILDTIRCIEVCHMLGIKNLVVHSGYEDGLTKEETFERNKEFFMRLLERAEKFGINILVENFNKMCVENLYWIDNAPDLLELIELVNHPLFHAVWDTGHGNMQEMSQQESLSLLGGHVYALHVQDNGGNDDEHLAPFFGSMNLDSLMHGLLDIGYNGYFTFEACKMLMPAVRRRTFNADYRLLKAPTELRIKAEGLLYEIGKQILSAYDCFEE